MTRKPWLTTLWAALLSFTACVGGMGCLATGMRLDVNLPLMVIGFGILCLTMALCFHIRLPWLPFALLALAGGYLWQEGTLRHGLGAVLYDISVLYDMGYGWGVLVDFAPPGGSADATAALLMLGVGVALFVIWTINSGNLGWVGAVAALVPLAPCLVLIDTVPDAPWLAILLGTVLLILLTQGVRERDNAQGDLLCAILVVPVFLGMTALFLLFPRASYNWQDGSQKLEKWILAVFQREEESLELPLAAVGDQEKTVQLADLGPKTDLYGRVMTVTAQETGTLYLRGSAYDTYDGTAWTRSDGWNAWDVYFFSEGDPIPLTITTEQPHEVLYFTYNPHELPTNIIAGQVKNKEKKTSYTTYYRKALVYDKTWDDLDEPIGGEMLKEYLQLPDSTKERAQYILTHRIGMPGKITNAGQVWESANYLSEYVRQLARYDLNSKKMPSEQEDFALWFLESGETGYCVHFATTATVLLRAAGIPARYVTGYLVEAKAGETVTVRTRDAHAWVEYFVNGKGWLILEPTPAAGITPAPLPEDTEPTAQPTAPESRPNATQPEETPTQESSEAATTQTTSPVGGGIGQQGPGRPMARIWGKLLVWLLGIVIAVTVVLFQWQLRLVLQRRTLSRGTANRQALYCWQAVTRRSRLLKEPPPQQLHELALKAKFSQHTLTEAELAQFHRELARQNARLKKKNLLLQPLYMLILALY